MDLCPEKLTTCWKHCELKCTEKCTKHPSPVVHCSTGAPSCDNGLIRSCNCCPCLHATKDDTSYSKLKKRSRFQVWIKFSTEYVGLLHNKVENSLSPNKLLSLSISFDFLLSMAHTGTKHPSLDAGWSGKKTGPGATPQPESPFSTQSKGCVHRERTGWSFIQKTVWAWTAIVSVTASICEKHHRWHITCLIYHLITFFCFLMHWSTYWIDG